MRLSSICEAEEPIPQLVGDGWDKKMTRTVVDLGVPREHARAVVGVIAGRCR